MVSKIIAVAILALIAFGIWELFFYYERVKNQKEETQKQAASASVAGEQLEGLPSQLENSLRDAKQQGGAALGNWLKSYGHLVQDPRKAWVELDYCILIFRNSPAEARRIFASVKERTPPSSPVWPRIRQLEKTFE
jgi:ABC-type Na+ efflux pump permease subunit